MHAHSGHVTYIAETLTLGHDGILARVLLLMDQQQDLGNYLWECIVQGFLVEPSLPEIFAEITWLLDLFSEIQQRE